MKHCNKFVRWKLKKSFKLTQAVKYLNTLSMEIWFMSFIRCLFIPEVQWEVTTTPILNHLRMANGTTSMILM